MSAPRISVIMSVYNGEPYLREAVESILNQTFGDFEFIIINDGSTDGTGAILARYQRIDDRIRVYHQENQGLIASLNRGCHLAQGKYIARMDADDVSLPDRLARQAYYMEVHPEIGILGTWIEYIDENGEPRGEHRIPTAPGLIGWLFLFGNFLAHPSVMMRRNVVERVGFYRPEALHVEDYDLWMRASIFTGIANIPEALLQYRVWEGSVCSRYFQTQEQNVVKVMHSMISRLLGSEVSIEAIAKLRQVSIGSSLVSLQQIEAVARLIQKLFRAYSNTYSLSHIEAREVAQDALRKLYGLAVSANKVSRWKGFVIFIQALRLNPQVLCMRIITKCLRTLRGKT